MVYEASDLLVNIFQVKGLQLVYSDSLRVLFKNDHVYLPRYVYKGGILGVMRDESRFTTTEPMLPLMTLFWVL